MAIYFVQEKSSEGFIKIGHTGKSVRGRVKGFQTGNPHKLECLAVIKNGTKVMEQEIHKLFSDCNYRREWFYPNPNLMEYINSIGYTEDVNSRNHKYKQDFSDLSQADMLRMVTNTALVAKESGGELSIFNGKLKGGQGVMIWIPDYSIQNGEMNKLPLVANEETK